MGKRMWLSALMVVGILGVSPPARATVLITEILADPASGIAGDANSDGVSSSTQDEFVELFNIGDQPVDLSGWAVSDALKARHVFPSGTILGAKDLVAVFGGGNPNLPGVNWEIASTGGLSLNNSGETVSLFDAQGALQDQVNYGDLANYDQSIVRSPEAENGVFVLHSSAAGAQDRRFSPGVLISPPPTQSLDGPVSAVPEPLTLLSLGLGLPFAFIVQKKKASLSV